MKRKPISLTLTQGVSLLVLSVVCLLWPTALYAQEGNGAGQLSPEALAIARAVNSRRAEAGLAPLAIHPLLNQAAQQHVNDMVSNGHYGHMGSDGSYVRQRVGLVGYSAGGWASENWVAAANVDRAMTWWMNDWIHRENILNPRWREIGIGAGQSKLGYIFVTVFTAGNGAQGGVATAAPEPLALPPQGLDYTVQPGDTLIAIAARYGIDWTMIAVANNLKESSLLQIGQSLRLPGVANVGGPAPALPEPAPALDEKLMAVIPVTEAAAASVIVKRYRVQPGDTLLAVALRHNLTWEALAAANALTGDELLQIDQELAIPGPPTPVAAPSAPAEPTLPPPAEVQPIIQSADAQPVAPVATAATEPPAAEPLVAAAVAQPSQTHTVAAGETIISIALRYNVDWRALLAFNGLTESSLLQIDQTIRIP
jgi:uncharacterized protein YkwD/LysM repeat protein